MGESNTGSCRTHTPFSTTASIAQPTAQCVHTVRFTSIRPAPTAGLPSAALALRTRASCEVAMPAPTPSPERRRKALRSMVGKAFDRPRCRLLTRGARSPDAVGAWVFRVSNMGKLLAGLIGQTRVVR
jgi:hypothetical protein